MNTIKVPVWDWIVSVIFLLLNGMGILNFIGQLNTTPETLSNMSQEQQDLFCTQQMVDASSFWNGCYWRNSW